ncbi:MAG: methyltransferase domain-containing protein [Ginsengibacter sp.]
MEKVPNSSPEEIEYQNYHWKRFNFAFQLIRKLKPENALEIGPYTLTHNLVRAGVQVDTLGFISEKITGVRTHSNFDLNQIGGHPEEMLSGNYDLVVVSEVIEHVVLDLDTIFIQLNKLTKIGGCVLIQTPNAVALKKRAAMFFGKNPFEMIRNDYRPGYGGHIREFTMDELVEYAKKNGFEIVSKHRNNYFGYNHSVKARIYKIFCDLLPPSFRDGITLVLKKINVASEF